MLDRMVAPPTCTLFPGGHLHSLPREGRALRPAGRHRFPRLVLAYRSPRSRFTSKLPWSSPGAPLSPFYIGHRSVHNAPDSMGISVAVSTSLMPWPRAANTRCPGHKRSWYRFRPWNPSARRPADSCPGYSEWPGQRAGPAFRSGWPAGVMASPCSSPRMSWTSSMVLTS